MKMKKPKPAVSPLAYKLILSVGITLLLISIHYSYFSPAGYGDWMLGALAALVNSNTADFAGKTIRLGADISLLRYEEPGKPW